VAAAVADVAEVITSAGVARPILVGWSHGAAFPG